MSVNNETDNQPETQIQTRHEVQDAAPVYQKPVLRKYDQIEQVKPYGPSEREAG